MVKIKKVFKNEKDTIMICMGPQPFFFHRPLFHKTKALVMFYDCIGITTNYNIR